MTYKFVTDSTTDLSESYINSHDIIMLELTVTLADITYQTIGENRLTSDFLLEKWLKVQTQSPRKLMLASS